MTGTLRKMPGTPAELGAYAVSGTLEGLTPGRRRVRRLEVRRVTEESVDGLRPLLLFTDLKDLELEQIRGVDLNPLTRLSLELERLGITGADAVDLGPLGQLPEVRELVLKRLTDSCRVPEQLELPRPLRFLSIVNDGPRLSGEPVRRLIEAIDWQKLAGLDQLHLRVGGLEQIEPIEVDLGFLRLLPNLTRLDMDEGIRHKGPGPSPLEPPFEGLSHRLTWLRIDACHPEPLKRALYAYLPNGAHVSVYQRYGPEPQAASWTIREPDEPGDPWLTYGSFADLYDAEHDVPTEHDGLKVARRLLREADPKLLRRLEFDPESSGTGVAARTREDLTAMLGILGITPPGAS